MTIHTPISSLSTRHRKAAHAEGLRSSSAKRSICRSCLMVSFLFAGITVSVSVDTENVCQSG
jgi:hypothetical protein